MEFKQFSLRAFAAILISISVACGGSSDSGTTPPPPPPPPAPEVASVTVSPASLNLDVGATQQLTASALDTHGNALGSPAPVWTTSDGGKVSVTSTGAVQGLAAGTATVTATVTTSGATKSASAVVTVVAPPVAASITVSPSSGDTLYSFGDTRALAATVHDASGTALTNAAITWSIDKASVASLSQTTGASINAVAAANGIAVITARSGSVSGTASIVVRQRAARLSVSPSAVTLAPGGTSQLSESALDARDNTVAGLAAPSYSASDTTKVRVSAAGVITAVAAGTATVSVSQSTPDGPLTATVAVTVAASSFPTTASISIVDFEFDPSSVDILAGGSVTWTWAGTQLHDVTPTVGNAFQSPTQTSGTFTSKFVTPGKFNYFCSVHPFMTGSVVVH